MRHGDAITTSRKLWSPFIYPVPGFEIVECGAKLENGKKIRRKREREEGISPSLPIPPLAVFSAHISLRRPHNLNSPVTGAYTSPSAETMYLKVTNI